ncbi:hypothetical protein HP456_01720 [Bacillus haikouensis]|jgi:hypothetical protein|uniref:hypothetical protein n=1 Tax=Bacillus haikouensis TaxID=1510468 RepID=UPI001557EEE5|nr:hypothetical protein [Bacillus haikouensis]NQD64642.1 hypothetical protein [Bacillus haikouensis]
MGATVPGQAQTNNGGFDFFSLLLVLLVVAFLVTLGIAPIAALIIGIALLLILVIGELF